MFLPFKKVDYSLEIIFDGHGFNLFSSTLSNNFMEQLIKLIVLKSEKISAFYFFGIRATKEEFSPLGDSSLLMKDLKKKINDFL